MADRTHIQWADATWSPVTGCTRVSEGCDHCYIERTVPFRVNHRRFDGPGIGATTGVRLHSERLGQPQTWRKPRRIFVCSMADLFHDEVPDRFIADVFAVMAIARQHTYQVLTKRPARMRSLLSSLDFRELVQRAALVRVGGKAPWLVEPWWPLANVWCGVSVENQRWADIRIPILLDTPAAVRWLSCEPLLGPLDLTTNEEWFHGPADCACDNPAGCASIDWVVIGGESGPGARPMHPTWAREIRDQCIAANNVPFHFKQWGEWGPAPWSVRVCDPAVGWHGSDAELIAAKAAAEAVGATHAMPVWSHNYDNMITEADHKPWSVERCPDGLPHTHAAMRRWGKTRAGRELDGRKWDEYPQAVARA